MSHGQRPSEVGRHPAIERQGYQLLAVELENLGLESASALVAFELENLADAVVADLNRWVSDKSVRTVLLLAVDAMKARRDEVIVEAFAVWDAIRDDDSGPEDGSPIVGDADHAAELLRSRLAGSTWRPARFNDAPDVRFEAFERANGGAYMRVMGRVMAADNHSAWIYRAVTPARWMAAGRYL